MLQLNINPEDFTVRGTKRFVLKKAPNLLDPLYQSKKEYKAMLEDFGDEINELQSMMYAHNRYGLLVIFQAMDAAGKDGTIKHVMSGVNPHGVKVHSFGKPSVNELDQDYMWRTNVRLPQRGTIGIFNRSYYEEVLVVKVHDKILTDYQRIPKDNTRDIAKTFSDRYKDIVNFEQYLHNNGMVVLKFFLNLSKDEQKRRFIDRIDEPEKNWKFSDADVKERGYWDDYMEAYEDCINATSSEVAPWHVIPANDKRNMRLIVSQIILDTMRNMKLKYPEVNDARREELRLIKEQLLNEGK